MVNIRLNDLTKNQYLFLTHVLVRDFFAGFRIIGWVYLYFQGLSIEIVLLSALSFRFLQISTFIPIVHRVIRYFSYKWIMFFGLLLQSIAFASFYFAAQGFLYLGISVILFSAYDSFYYVSRADLQRLTPIKTQVSKNIGFAGAAGILADILSVILTAYLLVIFPKFTFYGIFIGGLLSFIPIAFTDLKLYKTGKDKSFIKLISMNNSTIKWLLSPFVLLYLTVASVSELLEITPLVLAHLDIQLIDVAWIIITMKFISFLTSIFIGNYENANKTYLLTIITILNIILFVSFMLLSIYNLPYFLLLYGIFGIGWELGIHTIKARFLNGIIDYSYGGVFDQWNDSLGRAIMCLFLYTGFTYFYSTEITIHFLLGIGLVFIFSSFYLVSCARSKLEFIPLEK